MPVGCTGAVPDTCHPSCSPPTDVPGIWKRIRVYPWAWIRTTRAPITPTRCHGGSIVVLFTDGLVEHPARHLEEGLHTVAATAATALGEPLASLVRTLADNRPSNGSDDLALLAVRTPTEPPGQDQR
ncbi:SpoIIE family protein phosphatase [Streptomyces sp. NPDC002463]|uniref:SpoIIE family protein phosphatase n=1 Tax=Streptomyces sp. NPDC002463 TaxID=3364645 RepID=UPI0036AB8AB7